MSTQTLVTVILPVVVIIIMCGLGLGLVPDDFGLKADKRPFRLLGEVSLGQPGPNLSPLRYGVLMLQGSGATADSVYW